MDKPSRTTTVYPSFSECRWSKQAICSSSNAATTTAATTTKTTSNWGPSSIFLRRVSEANDHPKYAISAKDKSLHSESDKLDGADGYLDESSSVPKFWQIAFTNCAESKKCECHHLDVWQPNSSASTSSSTCTWTCQASFYTWKRGWDSCTKEKAS